MPTQLIDGLLLKMLKYFKDMLNFFEFSHVNKLWNIDWFVEINVQSCFFRLKFIFFPIRVLKSKKKKLLLTFYCFGQNDWMIHEYLFP